MNTDANIFTKFYRTDSNNTLKTSYTMVNLGLSEGCKDSSVYAKLV